MASFKYFDQFGHFLLMFRVVRRKHAISFDRLESVEPDIGQFERLQIVLMSLGNFYRYSEWLDENMPKNSPF